ERLRSRLVAAASADAAPFHRSSTLSPGGPARPHPVFAMDELFATRLLGTDVTLLALGYVVLAILIGLAVASLIQWVMRRATQHAPATSIVGAVVNALDGPLRWSVIVAAVWIAYEM